MKGWEAGKTGCGYDGHVMRDKTGGFLFALWLAAGLACGQPSPSEGLAFDGERAFQDLTDLVAIGPRPAGSVGAELARGLIAQRLRQAGWPVESWGFTAQAPDGLEVPMVDLIARRSGRRSDERVLVVTHYDTKRIPGVRFVGANDGASGVALMLELARQLARRELAYTLELLFFDGEEAFGENIDRSDGLYGSRALAQRMQAEGRLQRIRALVLIDMVADSDLDLSVDLGSDPRLRAIVDEEAKRLDLAHIINPAATLRLVDDHSPFVEKGVRKTIAFIDFQYGGAHSPGPLWHTARDDLSAVSAASLNSVGRLVVQTLVRLENREFERASGP